jgi:hypothetical protein
MGTAGSLHHLLQKRALPLAGQGACRFPHTFTRTWRRVRRSSSSPAHPPPHTPLSFPGPVSTDAGMGTATRLSRCGAALSLLAHPPTPARLADLPTHLNPRIGYCHSLVTVRAARLFLFLLGAPLPPHARPARSFGRVPPGPRLGSKTQTVGLCSMKNTVRSCDLPTFRGAHPSLAAFPASAELSKATALS